MKKILIISHNSLSLHSNNGKTFTSLFGDWTARNLAQLYFQEETPESVKFNNFFRVRDVDVIKAIILLGCFGGFGKKILPLSRVLSHYGASGWLKFQAVRFFRRFNYFKLLFRDLLYGTGLWRSKALSNWIKEFSPDSVFFVGGNSSFSFFIAGEIASYSDIPIDIYITDDYIINPKPEGLLGPLLLKRLRMTYRLFFQKARHVFVIGEDMALAFGQEFGRDFIPVMNSVPIPISLPRRSFTLRHEGAVDIVYAGSFHLGRDRSLARFGSLIREISSETGLKVVLTIYSLQIPDKRVAEDLSKCGVVYAGALDRGNIDARLSEADFVLHVESFDVNYVGLTKLSVSTKIPEYLTSGTCLIAFGPSELASMRLIERNAVGVCLSEKDQIIEMKEKLVSAFSSSERRRDLALRGFALAKREFDNADIRGRFASLLNH